MRFETGFGFTVWLHVATQMGYRLGRQASSVYCVEVLEKIYDRLVRPFGLAGGLLCYVVFSWALQQSGSIRITDSVYFQIIAVWMLGFGGLALLPSFQLLQDKATRVLLRTLWCNLGVITLAFLAPDDMRLFMLVVTLFGLMYASIYLKRIQVAAVGLLTFLFYLACCAGVIRFSQADLSFELLSGMGYGLSLAAGLVLVFEAHKKHEDLQQRNASLQATMGRLREVALRDDLTGVHNRRYLLDVLERQKAMADRAQQGFTLCYCDLDHFKQINDEFGHAIGDRVLQQFAELAAGIVRNIDYVGRFGGEEFVMVLVGAEQEAAVNIANRLRERTQQLRIEGAQAERVLTVSVGVTGFRGGERVEDALNRADRALYTAKANGRNQVVLA